MRKGKKWFENIYVKKFICVLAGCFDTFSFFFFYRKLPYFRIWRHEYNVRIYMFLTRSIFLVIKSPENRSRLLKLKLENYFSKKATLESIKIRKRLKIIFEFWIRNYYKGCRGSQPPMYPVFTLTCASQGIFVLSKKINTFVQLLLEISN